MNFKLVLSIFTILLCILCAVFIFIKDAWNFSKEELKEKNATSGEVKKLKLNVSRLNIIIILLISIVIIAMITLVHSYIMSEHLNSKTTVLEEYEIQKIKPCERDLAGISATVKDIDNHPLDYVMYGPVIKNAGGEEKNVMRKEREDYEIQWFCFSLKVSDTNTYLYLSDNICQQWENLKKNPVMEIKTNE